MFTEKDINSEPKLIDFGLANKYDVTHLKYKIISLSLENLKHLWELHSIYLQKLLMANMMKNVIFGVSECSYIVYYVVILLFMAKTELNYMRTSKSNRLFSIENIGKIFPKKSKIYLKKCYSKITEKESLLVNVYNILGLKCNFISPKSLECAVLNLSSKNKLNLKMKTTELFMIC